MTDAEFDSDAVIDKFHVSVSCCHTVESLMTLHGMVRSNGRIVVYEGGPRGVHLYPAIVIVIFRLEDLVFSTLVELPLLVWDASMVENNSVNLSLLSTRSPLIRFVCCSKYYAWTTVLTGISAKMLLRGRDSTRWKINSR